MCTRKGPSRSQVSGNKTSVPLSVVNDRIAAWHRSATRQRARRRALLRASTSRAQIHFDLEGIDLAFGAVCVSEYFDGYFLALRQRFKAFE